MSSPALADLSWPDNPTTENMAEVISRACNIPIELAPIPSQLSHPEVSGLTIIVDGTAHVYYDPSLSPLNRIQTIAHEYAHILSGDVRIDGQPICHRTTFDDPREQRAEMLAMELLSQIRRRQRRSRSAILTFISGDHSAI